VPGDLELWNRIAAFTPDDPGAQFQFTDRLARENGWTKPFALGAVEEYKRFVYLACVSDTQVTPSDIVDQVWHLHLTFTRSYWNDLCGEVLQRPLHHGPTKGGPAEDRRYRNQYAATLALYRSEFGGQAPHTYWPGAQARFASAAHQRWADLRTHWIIRKPSWRQVAAAIALPTAPLVGATAASGDDAIVAGLDGDIVVIGLGVAAVLLLAVLVGLSATAPKKKSNNGSCGGGGGGGCGSGGKDGGGGDSGGGCSGCGGGCGGGA
jgi:uncharacterized membrane protein YgcG